MGRVVVGLDPMWSTTTSKSQQPTRRSTPTNSRSILLISFAVFLVGNVFWESFFFNSSDFDTNANATIVATDSRTTDPPETLAGMQDDAPNSGSVPPKRTATTTTLPKAGKETNVSPPSPRPPIEQDGGAILSAASSDGNLTEKKRQKLEQIRRVQERLRAGGENKVQDPHHDDEEPDFPYRLSCPNEALPPGDYKIALAYHVGMINNWKTIVRDQMHTLNACGLGKRASEFILSYSGGDLQDLQEVMKPSGLFGSSSSSSSLSSTRNTTATATTTTIIVESVAKPWEALAMNTIQAHCAAKRDLANTIVFYMHSKGASHWQEDWKQHMDSPASYAYSLYWRKYMEYFTLERPALCIDRILHQGAGSCGINFLFNHFSGNFWAASCNYLRTLTPLNMSDTLNTVAAEVWIGSNRDANVRGRKPVSLHENPSTLGLYRHLILPSEYSDYGSRWNAGQSYYNPHPDSKELAGA